MNCKKKIKKIIFILQKHGLIFALVTMTGCYTTLFIAFILVVTHCSPQKDSDWFLENFSIVRIL